MRHRLEYLLVRAAIAIVRLMPDSLVDACGTALGRAFYLVDAKRRRIAATNLALAFPGRSEVERRAIVRGAFEHFGRVLLDLLKFSGRSPQDMLSRVEFEGSDRVRLAHAQGKGVFFLSSHFGSWEVNGLVHALHFAPIGVLVRPLDNAPVNALLEEIRQRTGNTVISRKGTIRRVLRMLQEGSGVAVLIDQHVNTKDAVRVDFFNRPAATTPLISSLALRTGAPIVPAITIPIGRGRYRVVYEHPIEPPPAEAPDAIQVLTQRCTDSLEMWVRRYPHMWLWMHRRWRENTGQEQTEDESVSTD
jgi:KDO2-lipid IV(A) lauroyltransferase